MREYNTLARLDLLTSHGYGAWFREPWPLGNRNTAGGTRELAEQCSVSNVHLKQIADRRFCSSGDLYEVVGARCLAVGWRVVLRAADRVREAGQLCPVRRPARSVRHLCLGVTDGVKDVKRKKQPCPGPTCWGTLLRPKAPTAKQILHLPRSRRQQME